MPYLLGVLDLIDLTLINFYDKMSDYFRNRRGAHRTPKIHRMKDWAKKHLTPDNLIPIGYLAIGLGFSIAKLDLLTVLANLFQ